MDDCSAIFKLHNKYLKLKDKNHEKQACAQTDSILFLVSYLPFVYRLTKLINHSAGLCNTHHNIV